MADPFKYVVIAEAAAWLAEFVYRPTGVEPADLALSTSHAYSSAAGVVGAALRVRYLAIDARTVGTPTLRHRLVEHRIPLNPSVFVDRDRFRVAVRDAIRQVAQHEADEFIEVAGERIYEPHAAGSRYPWPVPR